MQKEEIESLLKQELKIQKDIIALKPLKEVPKNIPPYDGCATPGLCTQIGEILNDGSVFYIKREHNGCYEGLIATGVCAVDREEYLAEVKTFMGMSPYHTLIQQCTTMMPTLRLYPLQKLKTHVFLQAH